MLRPLLPLLILQCICVVSLSGCGQTGALYLPEQETPQTETPDPLADDEQTQTPTDSNRDTP